MSLAHTPTIVALLDTPDTHLGPAQLELLTIARSLGEVVAVALGEPSQETLDQLHRHGAARLTIVDAGTVTALSPVAAEALAVAARAVDVDVILLTTTFANREVAALVARDLDAGLALAARPEGIVDGRLRTSKRVLAGTWDVTSEVCTERAVVTVPPNAVAATTIEPIETVVTRLTHEPSSAATATALVSRTMRPADVAARPALGEASIVVAGGRGTGGDFAPVEDLADALGAAVGATRDAVDEGWIGHDAQIGQTGVTIAPRVYIGAGISGAPHHRGGMQAAERIISVNEDPEAPLLEMSDFAVVGDLAEVLPQAAAAIRAHRAGPTQ